MSIKDSLSDLIAANGYDINNNEVRSALLSLAGSNIINLPLDKKHIAIRILSNGEYDKYIKNGTADGSISKDNTNVWHYDNSVGIGVMNKGYGFTSVQQDSFITIFITATDYSGTWTYTFTVKGEHIQNNKSSSSSHRFFNSLTFKTQSAVGMHGGGASYSAINTKTINSSFEDAKDKTTNSNSIESYIREGYWNNWNRVILYYNFTYNYRPVFQFIDNNKSVNIHY